MRILCFFIFLTASTQVFSIELETVLVTGRAGEVEQKDMASSVGLVDQVDLNLVQATHINEAADRVAGVWISRGNGQESLMAIRSPVFTGAGACGEFLVLQDGIPVRPAGFCNANELLEINSEQAQRLEILKGPNSAIYGTNALHGIINVVMPAVPESEKSSVRIDGGPHDYTRGFLQYGDGKSVLVAGHADHDGGYKDDAGFDQQKLSVKTHRLLSDINNVSFIEATNLRQETAGYITGENAYKDDSRKKDNLNPEAYRDTNSIHGYSRFDGFYGGNRWQITPYANTSEMNFVQHWLPGNPLEENNHVSVGLDSRYFSSLSFDNNRALGIVSGFTVEEGRASIKQSIPTLVHYDFDVWMTTAGIFAELEYPVADTIKLVGALRYDHAFYRYDSKTASGDVGNYTRLPDRDDEFGNWSENIGLIWEWKTSRQFYFNLSNGFRVPQIAELYRLEGGTPADLVDSEALVSIEAGMRGLINSGADQSFLYEVNIFDMQKNNVIIKDASRQYIGDGKTSHQGVELSLEYRFTPVVYVKAELTYAEHRYKEVDHQLFGSPLVDVNNNIIDTAPRHMGNIVVGKFYNWGLAELELKHMGSYYLDPEHDWSYEGHNLFNVRVQYTPAPDWEMTARLLNITDRDYAERADVGFGNVPRYFVGEPRSLYLSVQKNF